MNPSLLAAAAASLLAVLWLAGRRRAPLPMVSDTSAVAALNRAQIERMHRAEAPPSEGTPTDEALAPMPGASPGEGGGAGPSPLSLPATARERLAFRSTLEALYRQGGQHRRQAMAAARRWRHPDGLPLLRRGLHDADPTVMREAALGMEAFRGKPRPRRTGRNGTAAAAPAGRPAQAPAVPRNVARMR
jgi:hypothetical protein